MRRVLIIVMFMALASTAGAGAEPVPTGLLFAEIEVDGREYPYAVYVPREYDPSREWPGLVFLHGYGECGTDGARQLSVGLAPAIMANPGGWPFIVIMPQKPDGESQWEDHDDAVMAMLRRTKDTYRIDEDRVSLTGLSQGGHGTWAIGGAHPAVWAAMVPVCAYVDTPEVGPDRDWSKATWSEDPTTPLARAVTRAAQTTPVWAFHGEADSVIPVAQSRFIVDAIREAGSDSVRLTTYARVDHNSWVRAYRDPELPKWLLSQKRAD